MDSCKIFVITGEISGDKLAFELLKQLSEFFCLEIFGTGGINLKKLGQKQYVKIEDLEVIGFDGLIKKSFFIFNVFKLLMEKVKEIKPDIVLLVDYPGFNIRFAKIVKKLGYKVIYYVTPQVWAWHKNRIKKLKKYTDLVLSILPFEENMLADSGINIKYVGNPIRERIKVQFNDRESFLKYLSLDKDTKIIGVLPGSRKNEIRSLMPVIANSANRLKDFVFLIAKVESIEKSTIEQYINELENVKIIENFTYDIMKYSEILWICSGTATLEAALIGKPMIILYKISKITYFLAKCLVKIKCIGLPNIILNRKFIPELLQDACNDENLVKTTFEVLENSEYYTTLLDKVSALITPKKASSTAAWEIYSYLKNNTY